MVSRTGEWGGMLGTKYSCADLPVNLTGKYEWFSRAIGKWLGFLYNSIIQQNSSVYEMKTLLTPILKKRFGKSLVCCRLSLKDRLLRASSDVLHVCREVSEIVVRNWGLFPS